MAFREVESPAPLVEGWTGFDGFSSPADPPTHPTDRAAVLALAVDFDLPSSGDCVANSLPGASATRLTSHDAITEVKFHLIEPDPEDPTDFAENSDGWTIAEVVGYFNQRQAAFLRDTGVVLQHSVIPAIQGVHRHPLPQGCISIVACWWKKLGGEVHETNRWHEVRRGDSFEADAFLTINWATDLKPRPLIYSDEETPTLQIMTAPPTFSAGIFDILHTFVSEAFVPGEAINFTVPNEFVPTIKWGVISDMLSKMGRFHDAARAAYAEGRYQEGLAAAELLLLGFS